MVAFFVNTNPLSVQLVESPVDAFVEAVAELIVELFLVELVFKLIERRVVGKVVVFPIEVALKFRFVELILLIVLVDEAVNFVVAHLVEVDIQQGRVVDGAVHGL